MIGTKSSWTVLSATCWSTIPDLLDDKQREQVHVHIIFDNVFY